MAEPWGTAALLAALGLLLVLAGLASPLSGRLGVPALVVFVLLGMLAGSEGLGGIPFDDYALAYRLGSLALVLILFDGGLNTPLPVLRRVLPRAGLLATVSVMLTAGVVALAGLALGLPPVAAALVGAVVSSTDAAAVFSVLRTSGLRLRASTAATLEVESGLNDPMAVILTATVTGVALGEVAIGPGLAGELATQLGVGVAGGIAFGYASRWLLRAFVLPAAGLYPVLTFAVALLSFGGTTLAGGSGFLAVYLAAIVLADGPMPYRAGIRRVHDALAWLSQILMFVLLGLLVFPSRLLPHADEGLALAAVLAFVARPLAVFLVLVPFRMPQAERWFVSWVGLRGAVPIVLAAYPALRGLPEGDAIFHLVFFVVLASAIVPGATVAPLARRLGLGRASGPALPASVELVSLREFSGEFVWYSVDRASAAAGAEVRDLPLPDDSLAILVLRGNDVLAPRGDTRLAPGDHVCVFVKPETRRLLDLVFGGSEDEAE